MFAGVRIVVTFFIPDEFAPLPFRTPYIAEVQRTYFSK